MLALGDAVMRDMLDGTRHTGSPLPADRRARRPRADHGRAHAALRRAGAAAGRAGRRRGPASVRPPQAADLTHLVTVSCTGFVAPGIDLALIRALGLPPTVQRTHVGYMGCHGAFNGLRVARAFTRRRAGRPRPALCRGVMHSALSLWLGRAKR